MEVVNAVGRRKTAVARVYLNEGKGNITINKKSLEEYFTLPTLQYIVKQPLELLGVLGQYDIKVNLVGGGFNGQAEALRLVYEAQAKGITYINDAHPDQAYVTLQGFKALENLSKGDATKIIIPSELQGIAGLATTLKEVVSEKKDKE